MRTVSGVVLLAGVLMAACSAGEPANETTGPDASVKAPAGEVSADIAVPAETASTDDPITALCVDMMPSYSAEVCACGTEAFRSSTEDADTYAEMASYYLNETDPALSLVERWDEVVDVVLADTPGSALQVSNALGKTHRAAINDCAG